MNLSGIKHLIFDLGGVMMDLDTGATFRAFEKLTGQPADKWQKMVSETSFFLNYEMGRMTDGEFRDGIRELAAMPLTDEQIDNAWNAMLGPIPAARMERAANLRPRYQTFVLSNTNSIHEKGFTQILQKETGRDSLEHFFDKVYFSHIMNRRKPDVEIYEVLLNENNLVPEQVLFLDDRPDNLEGAARLKIRTFLVPSAGAWFELFT